MVLYCGQWLEGLVCFVYIGGIVDHHCLNLLFITHVISVILCICFIIVFKCHIKGKHLDRTKYFTS